jgi:uncharacterized DUF497 family protein
MDLEFEWDPDKAESNLRKHRLTFPYASRVFAAPYRIENLDEGEHYGEERWLVIGRVDEFVLAIVYTVRFDRIRMISARRATHHEFIEYWNGPVSA